MTARAKSPATATAKADDTEVRDAETGADNLPEERPEQEQEPERDSLEDIVRRVEKLEFRIF